MACLKGLHPEEGPGECKKCRTIRQMRYHRTLKGKEMRSRASAAYYHGKSWFWRHEQQLKKRRARALKRREQRRLRG